VALLPHYIEPEALGQVAKREAREWLEEAIAQIADLIDGCAFRCARTLSEHWHEAALVQRGERDGGDGDGQEGQEGQEERGHRAARTPDLTPPAP
jgi:hypothetical protein